MIRIAMTEAAFEAIPATLLLGSVGSSAWFGSSGPSLTSSTPCAGWLRPSVGALIRGRKRPSS
jgi:hypothetical protein